MSDRPTPEQIAAWPECKRDAEALLDNFNAFGYLVVHPDDCEGYMTRSDPPEFFLLIPDPAYGGDR